MNDHKPEKSLICTADGFVIRITADDRFVYFYKLAREKSRNFDGPTLGCYRLVKADIESVDCCRHHGKTMIVFRHEGVMSRLEVKGQVNESALFELFSGLQVNMSLHRPYAMSPEIQELTMLSVSFLLAILRVLTYSAPEIGFIGPLLSLGWMVIGPLWLVFCARQKAAEGIRHRFPCSAGFFAALFSCGFLWLDRTGDLTNWTQVILPAAILTVLMVILYAAARRQWKWKEFAAVALMAALIYSPVTVIRLNELLPAREVIQNDAVVAELSTDGWGGDWRYYVHLEVDDYPHHQLISGWTPSDLDVGDTVKFYEKKGCLGIDYTMMQWQ